MLFNRSLSLILGLITLSNATRIPSLKGDPVLNPRVAASVTCLSESALQTGSDNDGQATTLVSGQTPSATDPANFINFCSGEDVLTNGLQIATGSCNGVVMGKIPSTSNMISSILVSPTPGQKMEANKTFDVQVQTYGISAGGFTNEDSTYYSAPQDLSSDGLVIGHTHISIQDLGESLAPTTPPDPTQFVFFAAVPDDGNGNGLFSATVTGGLPEGNYRVCSMASTANHQPVIMPVAKRGSQDDCQKFTVAKSTGK